MISWNKIRLMDQVPSQCQPSRHCFFFYVLQKMDINFPFSEVENTSWDQTRQSISAFCSMWAQTSLKISDLLRITQKINIAEEKPLNFFHLKSYFDYCASSLLITITTNKCLCLMECEPCLGQGSCWFSVQSIMQSHFPCDKYWNNGEKYIKWGEKKTASCQKWGFWLIAGRGLRLLWSKHPKQIKK